MLPPSSTCCLRAPSFALLLLLAIFVLVLAELQEALGDLVVGVAALQVSGGQGEGVEAFPFGFGALGLQPGQGGGGRGRGELQRVQLQRLGAARKQGLIRCCRWSSLKQTVRRSDA